MLREPRAHLLSQYMMCVHAAPWISSVDRPVFLRASKDPTAQKFNDTLFMGWLRFFATGWASSNFGVARGSHPVYPADWVLTEVEGRSIYVQASTGQAAEVPPFATAQALLASATNKYGDWGCYHPRDMQVRQLSSFCRESPHHIYPANERLLRTEKEKALVSAAAALEHLGFVGITELYSLSLCLLLHRLGARELPALCHTKEAEFTLTREVHKVPRYSIADVSAASLALADELTTQDVQLYALGRRRLLREYEEYQRRAAAAGWERLGEHLLEPSRV